LLTDSTNQLELHGLLLVETKVPKKKKRKLLPPQRRSKLLQLKLRKNPKLQMMI
jgi:nicotinic acid mononucleotide adenylyltransferase